MAILFGDYGGNIVGTALGPLWCQKYAIFRLLQACFFLRIRTEVYMPCCCLQMGVASMGSKQLVDLMSIDQYIRDEQQQ